MAIEKSEQPDPRKKKPSAATNADAPAAKPGPVQRPVANKPSPLPVQPRPTQARPDSLQEEEIDDAQVGRFVLFNVIPSWVFSFLAHILLILTMAIFIMPVHIEKQVTFEGGETSSASFDSMDVNLDAMELDAVDPFETEITESAAMEVTTELEQVDLAAPEADADLGDILAGDSESFDQQMSSELVPSDFSNETGMRDDNSKQAALRKFGGSAESESAVELALKWIVAHQMPDGGWNLDHRIGPGTHRDSPDPGSLLDRKRPGVNVQARNAATALALLPLLGHGNTHKSGKYKKAVFDGLSFLMQNADRNGRMVSFYEPGGELYSHGLVSIVLCEAMAMTEDPELTPYAQGAIWYLEEAQDPSGGGWRYVPGQAGDTSVVGWQVMALKSAKTAGLEVKPITLKRVNRFLDAIGSQSGHMYGYDDKITARNNRYRACSAIGLLCRMYLGWDKDVPGLQQGVDYLTDIGPDVDPDDRVISMYYNYYATQVVKHYGEEEWKTWNEAMRDFLVETQEKESNAAGSWMFEEESAQKGGRLYATSLACMTLEVYYRYLPLYTESAVNEAFPLD